MGKVMSTFFNYEFTGKEKLHSGVVVKQIRRIGDGLIGGWIEKPENLVIQPVGSPAWVGEHAVVYGDAVVDRSATVCGNAVVCGKSHITEAAYIDGCAVVKDSHIYGNSHISHEAIVENSTVGDSTVKSSSKVYNAELKFCKFRGWASVSGGKFYNRRYDGQYWWPKEV